LSFEWKLLGRSSGSEVRRQDTAKPNAVLTAIHRDAISVDLVEEF